MKQMLPTFPEGAALSIPGGVLVHWPVSQSLAQLWKWDIKGTSLASFRSPIIPGARQQGRAETRAGQSKGNICQKQRAWQQLRFRQGWG